VQELEADLVVGGLEGEWAVVEGVLRALEQQLGVGVDDVGGVEVHLSVLRGFVLCGFAAVGVLPRHLPVLKGGGHVDDGELCLLEAVEPEIEELVVDVETFDTLLEVVVTHHLLNKLLTESSQIVVFSEALVDEVLCFFVRGGAVLPVVGEPGLDLCCFEFQ
jgi:hypothetical protein